MAHQCGEACGCGHDHGGDPGGERFGVAVAPKPWRPGQGVRVIAIAVIERAGQVLAGPVYDDAGQIIGWRPLGGAVEPGERAEAAVMREMAEETGQGIEGLSQIAVMENIFHHEGAMGHEIVFVFRARFADAALYEADQIAFAEADGREEAAKWVSLAKAQAGRVRLFPEGLADLL